MDEEPGAMFLFDVLVKAKTGEGVDFFMNASELENQVHSPALTINCNCL